MLIVLKHVGDPFDIQRDSRHSSILSDLSLLASNNECIRKKYSVRCLKVNVTQNLSWKKHAEIVLRKLRRLLSSGLRKLRVLYTFLQFVTLSILTRWPYCTPIFPLCLKENNFTSIVKSLKLLRAVVELIDTLRHFIGQKYFHACERLSEGISSNTSHCIRAASPKASPHPLIHFTSRHLISRISNSLILYLAFTRKSRTGDEWILELTSSCGMYAFLFSFHISLPSCLFHRHAH